MLIKAEFTTTSILLVLHIYIKSLLYTNNTCYLSVYNGFHPHEILRTAWWEERLRVWRFAHGYLMNHIWYLTYNCLFLPRTTEISVMDSSYIPSNYEIVEGLDSDSRFHIFASMLVKVSCGIELQHRRNGSGTEEWHQAPSRWHKFFSKSRIWLTL